MHPYLSPPSPVAFAHRGAHGRGCGENSVEAFERAVALGYRYLETDVHRTADGVLVAIHDPTLGRTTDGEGAVAARTWDEIAALGVTGGGRVPALRELLERWPGVRWNLDCKQPAAAADLVDLVRRVDAMERVCVGSFDTDVVARMRRAAGDRLCTAATRPEVRRLVIAARLPRWLRRPVVARLRCDVVQVPVAQGDTTIVTGRFVETCHELDLPVHVWTVDEGRAMHALLDLGVDGLMTDEAELLLTVLAERRDHPAS